MIRTYSLATSSQSYLDIIDHAGSIEQFSCETQGGSDKCAWHMGGFCRSQSRFRGQSDRPPLRF